MPKLFYSKVRGKRFLKVRNDIFELCSTSFLRTLLPDLSFCLTRCWVCVDFFFTRTVEAVMLTFIYQ